MWLSKARLLSIRTPRSFSMSEKFNSCVPILYCSTCSLFAFLPSLITLHLSGWNFNSHVSSAWNGRPWPGRSQNWMLMYFIINLSGSQQFSGSSIQNQVELSEWATGRFMHCVSDHSTILSTSFCRILLSSSEFILLKTLVSSAKSYTFYLPLLADRWYKLRIILDLIRPPVVFHSLLRHSVIWCY